MKDTMIRFYSHSFIKSLQNYDAPRLAHKNSFEAKCKFCRTCTRLIE
jgi:hypothetical protein